MKLALSETPKTGFVASGPNYSVLTISSPENLDQQKLRYQIILFNISFFTDHLKDKTLKVYCVFNVLSNDDQVKAVGMYRFDSAFSAYICNR